MEKFDTISHPPFLRFERFELYAQGDEENSLQYVLDLSTQSLLRVSYEFHDDLHGHCCSQNK